MRPVAVPGGQARNLWVLRSNVRLPLRRPEARGLEGEASHHLPLTLPPPRQPTFRLSHDARARAGLELGEGGPW